MIQLSNIVMPKRKRKKEKLNVKKTWKFIEKAGRLTDNTYQLGNYDNIVNFWKNEPCYVIGCGESLKGFDLQQLKGLHTIGINHLIEDYDGFEWFLFCDKRFLDTTTYDLKKYKGRIFASNKTGLKPKDNITIFTTTENGISLDPRQGLYHPHLSGIMALHLAIISGANPIYFMGQGQKADANPMVYHYKKGYPGASKTRNKMLKYRNALYRYLYEFCKYENRIINVSNFDNQIYLFKRIGLDDIKKKINIIPKKNEPRIIHLSFTNDINKMGDISRGIINNCYGKHELHSFGEKIPNADLYILEHFISTNNWCLQFPYKKKAIDIVHTMNCFPQNGYARIIALTNAWKTVLIKNGSPEKNIDVIYGGINIDEYKNERIELDASTFGRITRWSPGKIHPKWNEIVKRILDNYPEIKCLIYTEFVNITREKLIHERMIYDETVKINEYKGKYLKKMNIYVHANNTFKETLSHACIEAMATGLPIIYLSEPAIDEIVGDAGIRCNIIEEIEIQIIELMKNKPLRIEYSKKSKERSKIFDIKNTIKNFDILIKELL